MFGTIKKAMAVAAVVAVGAVAPSVASADVWDSTAPAHAGGRLTLTLPSGASTACDVTATIDLSNAGGVASGTITSFGLSACTTNVPNCTVTASASSLPWSVTTSGTNVTISGINFTNVYSGASCSLNGVSLTADGAITGTASGNVLTFTNAAGLTTPLGNPVVNGSVEIYAEDANGDPDFDAPISLVP